MQRRIDLYADEMQREGRTPVQIRVGLNSGDVVVRSIGSDLHMDYTAVGGKIWAQSQVREGSTFTFTIPVRMSSFSSSETTPRT